MQQSNRRPPPAPLDLHTPLQHMTTFRSRSSPRLPAPNPPPRTPLPALPTPPYSPCSPPYSSSNPKRGRRIVMMERSPSRVSCATPLSPASFHGFNHSPNSNTEKGYQHHTLSRDHPPPTPTLCSKIRTLETPNFDQRPPSSSLSRDSSRQYKRTLTKQREALVALPTRFQEDEEEMCGEVVHPFARAQLDIDCETPTLYSPTVSSYSATTYSPSASRQRTDERIADLEAQLRDLQDRLAETVGDARSLTEDGSLRHSKSMPFLRRLRRRKEKESEAEKATRKFCVRLVEDRKSGSGEVVVTEVEMKMGKEEMSTKEIGKGERGEKGKGKGKVDALAETHKSAIDLSHLQLKDKDKKRWRPWGKSKGS